MTDLVSLSDIQAQLQAQSETRLPLDAAYRVAQQMQATYETDRATAAQILAGVYDQVDTLVALGVAQDATIAALSIQVEDLSPDITVTVGNAPIATSHFETGVSHIVNKDLLYANATAKARGVANLGSAIKYHNRPLMAWGASDPWPWDGTGTRPAKPTNWASIDGYMKIGQDAGGVNILSTQLYPWHLKGKWNADGTTTKMLPTEPFSDDGVLLTSQVPAYRLLIREMALRYLAPPWNVKIVQTGVEFHGGYRGRDRTFNEWQWDAFPGTPGDHADMGLAYIHNITVEEVEAAAVSLNIDPASLLIIPNYPPIGSQGKVTNDSVPVGHPLRQRPWGTATKQQVSIIKNMPPLLKRYDAIAFDMALNNKDGSILQDDFAQMDKFDDIINYVKTTVPDKPLVISEIYERPQKSPAPSPQYRVALRAEAFRRFVLGGVWMVLIWGTAGESMDQMSGGPVPDAALLTDTSVATGGQPGPMLDVVRLYHEHFKPGTPLFATTVQGEGVKVLPSDRAAVLINTTASPHRVALDNAVYELGAYGVRAVLR